MHVCWARAAGAGGMTRAEAAPGWEGDHGHSACPRRAHVCSSGRVPGVRLPAAVTPAAPAGAPLSSPSLHPAQGPGWPGPGWGARAGPGQAAWKPSHLLPEPATEQQPRSPPESLELPLLLLSGRQAEPAARPLEEGPLPARPHEHLSAHGQLYRPTGTAQPIRALGPQLKTSP